MQELEVVSFDFVFPVFHLVETVVIIDIVGTPD
jgi:hypothetical protein